MRAMETMAALLIAILLLIGIPTEQRLNDVKIKQTSRNVMQMDYLLTRILQTGSLTKEDYLFCADSLAAGGCDCFRITAYREETARDGKIHSYVVTWEEIESQLEQNLVYGFQEDRFIRMEAVPKEGWNLFGGKGSGKVQHKIVRTGCLQ